MQRPPLRLEQPVTITADGVVVETRPLSLGAPVAEFGDGNGEATGAAADPGDGTGAGAPAPDSGDKADAEKGDAKDPAGDADADKGDADKDKDADADKAEPTPDERDETITSLRSEIEQLRTSVTEARQLKGKLTTAEKRVETLETELSTARRIGLAQLLDKAVIKDEFRELAELRLADADPFSDEGQAAVAKWVTDHPKAVRSRDDDGDKKPAGDTPQGGRGVFARALGRV